MLRVDEKGIKIGLAMKGRVPKDDVEFRKREAIWSGAPSSLGSSGLCEALNCFLRNQALGAYPSSPSVLSTLSLTAKRLTANSLPLSYFFFCHKMRKDILYCPLSMCVFNAHNPQEHIFFHQPKIHKFIDFSYRSLVQSVFYSEGQL